MIMPPSTSSCRRWQMQYSALSSSSSSASGALAALVVGGGDRISTLGLPRLEDVSACVEVLAEDEAFLVELADFLVLEELLDAVDSFLVVELVFFFFAAGPDGVSASFGIADVAVADGVAELDGLGSDLNALDGATLVVGIWSANLAAGARATPSCSILTASGADSTDGVSFTVPSSEAAAKGF